MAHSSKKRLLSLGFVGLGNMGMPMLQNLLRKNDSVIAFDASPARLALAKQSGALSASSPAEVAAKASIIVTMLPASRHVESVYLGGDAAEGNSNSGLLSFSNGKESNSNEKKLFVDCSTIDPSVSEKIHEEVNKKGHAMVDAPVSGGVGAATSGKLTFMAGGLEEGVKQAEPILKLMGSRVIHCGGPGRGTVAKVCNNLILGVTMLGVSEGYKLAKSLGIDLAVFDEIVNCSSGRCWTTECYSPVDDDGGAMIGKVAGLPSAREYKGGFAVDLMKKDLRIALDRAREGRLNLRAAKTARDVYAQLSEDGRGCLDFGCVYKYGIVGNNHNR